jgi:hypothetical protein
MIQIPSAYADLHTDLVLTILKCGGIERKMQNVRHCRCCKNIGKFLRQTQNQNQIQIQITKKQFGSGRATATAHTSGITYAQVRHARTFLVCQ